MPLPALYRERIFRPLALNHTAYDPQGPITGPQAHGYTSTPGGRLVHASDWHWGKGADGAIVSNAQDLAAFRIALVQGKLINSEQLATMARDSIAGFRPQNSDCGASARFGSGAGDGYNASIVINDNGSRLVVLLLNSRHTPLGDQIASDTAAELYCAA